MNPGVPPPPSESSIDPAATGADVNDSVGTNSPIQSQFESVMAVFSTMNDAVLALDNDYQVIYANPIFLELVEQPQNHIVGKPFIDLVDESDILTISGPESLFEATQTQTANVAFARSDGTDITLVVSTTILIDPNTQEHQFIVLGRDERDRMEAMARESRAAAQEQERAQELARLHQELKDTSEREMLQAKDLLSKSEQLSQLGSLIATIGHEMANPIMLIGVSLSNSGESIDKLEQFLTSVFTGSQEAEKAKAVVQDWLDDIRQGHETAVKGSKHLSSVSQALRKQSRNEVEFTPQVNLNEIIHESLILTSGRLRLHQINEDYQELPPVSCFQSKIAQVITNLISNAGDALTEKRDRLKLQGEKFMGEVSVASRAAEHQGKPGVLISISDNGDGVPDAIREKIFEQFFTTKPAGSGTGLGLSLCIEIVKSHGGTLEVGRDAALGGAQFALWLPCAMPEHAEYHGTSDVSVKA